MEYKDRKVKKPISVLHGDGFYLDRIMSRESSIGQSSRVYYRSVEGVPFKWEMQPGTPKNPQGGEVIPPLSPPPAVQSLGLPKPCIIEEPKKSKRSRIWFWKRIKKKEREKRNVPTSTTSNDDNIDVVLDRSEASEQRNSGEEFAASFRYSPNALSSLSSSSSSGPTLELSRSRRDYGAFYCSPWNIMSILVGVTRRDRF